MSEKKSRESKDSKKTQKTLTFRVNSFQNRSEEGSAHCRMIQAMSEDLHHHNETQRHYSDRKNAVIDTCGSICSGR